MSVYIVTGKLGSGKTLATVGKIKDYLMDGRPVATNLNINLGQLIGKTKRNTRFYRLPDHPELRDIEMLGPAYKGDYDENKTGAIVLDECGTWLNSRDWQDKTRRPLLDYLLHIRKRGWDVFFIVQDITLIDKQFRKALCEHVVYCRRLDRMSVPVVGWFYKLVTGEKMNGVKMHLGIVKYGDLPTSLTVDKWWYRGTDLYRAYDTTQFFKPDHSAATFCQLPPYYLHRNSIAKRDLRFFMRLTKIYARKYSRIASFVMGGVFLILLNFFLGNVNANQIGPSFLQTDTSVDSLTAEPSQQETKKESGLYSDPGNLNASKFLTLKITGYVGQGRYMFEDDDGFLYTTRDMMNRGFAVSSSDQCKAKLIKDDLELTVYCQFRSSGEPVFEQESELEVL